MGGSKFSYGEEVSNMSPINEFSPSGITRTKDFMQMARRCKD
jgi:hypothetical protein